MYLYRKTALVILVILLISPLVSCRNEAVPEVSSTRSACIELMQKVPVYSEYFEFWDVKALRDDPDLEEMYQILYERQMQHNEEQYGIESSDIDYLAEGESLNIFKTVYDISEVRDRIAVDFFRDTSYAGAEVWNSESSSDPQSASGAWLLAESLIVRGYNYGSIDEYLNVVGGEELSLYDENAADVLERLPDGITMRVMRTAWPEGLVIAGSSVSKEGEDVLRWTDVYKFESPEDTQSIDAEAYFDGIEDDFNEAESEFAKRGENSPFWDFALERQGEFVKWSVLIEEKYMIALLFYG